MRLIHGDCLDALQTLPDCSVDSVVTDPPAGISFMSRSWDSDRGGRDAWVAWLAERLTECHRVLKPGGHAVVWALPRTSGWTHRALEDAGFEVRDCLTHLFGSGFPKSLDVGKAIDKAAGAERVIVGYRESSSYPDSDGVACYRNRSASAGTQVNTAGMPAVTAPATAEAQQWDGWGTALKPSAEFWYLARKPLSSTVAGNVTTWGTGALNVDACRVAGVKQSSAGTLHTFHGGEDGYEKGTGRQYDNQGRWPANTVLSHNSDCADECSPGCAAAELDKQSGVVAGSHPQRHLTKSANNVYAQGVGCVLGEELGYGDSGGASRFFPTFRYVAKPSTREKGCGLDDRNTPALRLRSDLTDDERAYVEAELAKAGVKC